MELVAAKRLAWFVVAAATLACGVGQAETIYDNQARLIQSQQALATLGTDLFGDTVSLYTGETSFIQTDVDIAGNSGLPVSVARYLDPFRSHSVQGAFGNWDLAIPHVHGTFASNDSPQGGQGGWNANGSMQRCSAFEPPRPVDGNAGIYGRFEPYEFWQGVHLFVAGVGDQELLQVMPDTPRPATGSWPLVTQARWAIGCLSSIQNGTGEGFVALSPDGTRYTFDRMASRRLPQLDKPREVNTANPLIPITATLLRAEYWMLVTKVEDRFGNQVIYEYDPADAWKLDSIHAADGAGSSERKIQFRYERPDHPHLVTAVVVTSGAKTRIWTYDYSETSGDNPQVTLSTVFRPDDSRWDFSPTGSHDWEHSLYSQGGGCDDPGVVSSGQGSPFGWIMTHPSGVEGTFTFKAVRHGRSFVLRECYPTVLGSPFEYPMNPKLFDGFALKQKKLEGPGLDTLVWDYDYGVPNDSWSDCTGTCPTTKSVEVTEPDQRLTRYTFGNRFQVNEGQLLKTETGVVDTAAERTETRHYAPAPASPTPSHPYAARIGGSARERGDDYMTSMILPLDERTIEQDGTSFSWQVPEFDTLARPARTNRSSTLGSKSETRSYHDDLGAWVLGQPKTIIDVASDKVELSNTYNAATALLETTSRFGLLEQTLAYHPDGTLLSVTDALDHATQFDDWKRGIAQTVTFADNTTRSAVVDDFGDLRSVTDETGATTGYDYDAMGRIKEITPPTGDTVAWNPTTIVYAQVTSAEYGIAAGHWRRTETTGNLVRQTFYDGLWRPILERQYDATNPTGEGLSRFTRTDFDHQGRTTFAAYPHSSITTRAELADGTHTSYDALGRARTLVQDSELGSLTTQIEYLAGFRKKVTNPRNYATTISYQAFDQPSEDWPVGIIAPEGVITTIARDAWGKPTALTRGGVTRHSVYDANERLCKRIEPESGATLIDYDAASRMKWIANGQALASLSCDRDAVSELDKTWFSHDERNRLLGTDPPVGTASIARTYHADGALKTLSSDGSTWTYAYNKRRLPTSESLVQTGAPNWTLIRAYNPNGAQKQNDANGLVLDFAPDVFGRPTKVGSFATTVTYHPNGALKGFTYGNGITHLTTQNARSLPEASTDTRTGTIVTGSAVAYDGNGNPDIWADTTPTPDDRANRTMLYDGLDRLTEVHAPGLWGRAHYHYDGAGNFTSTEVGTAARTYQLDATHNRIESITGTNPLTLHYDTRGNLITRNADSFSFDALDRLKTAMGESYSYDGHGRRTKIARASGTSFPRYDRDGLLREDGSTSTPPSDRIFCSGFQTSPCAPLQNPASGTSASTANTASTASEADTTVSAHPDHASAGQSATQALAEATRYVYLGRHLIARIDAQGAHYQHTDPLGSPVAQTDAFGTLERRSWYEPFGKPFNGPYTEGPGYGGHVFDTTTRLSYLQQRYLDPDLGLFLSRDPVNPDPATGALFHRYEYAASNPYRNVDPDGRDPEMAYGAAVGFTLRNNPEAMRVWASGEAAATTEGPGAEAGAAVGLAIGDFFDTGDFSKAAVAGVVVKAAVMAVTHGKTHTTYTRTKSDGTVYSGRTSGRGTPEQQVLTRMNGGDHLARTADGYGPATVDRNSPNAAAIRGREQQLIEQNGGAQSQGGTSGNRINGVSPNNPKAESYQRACAAEFGCN